MTTNRAVICNLTNQNLQERFDMSNFAKEIANKNGKRIRFLNSYSIFHDVVDDSCRTDVCNSLIRISEYHKLDMERNNSNAMTNILFKSHSYFYAPRKERERGNILKIFYKLLKNNEKMLKLIAH